MLSFKNDYCFAYLDEQAVASPQSHKLAGFYLHDIRHLSQYQWHFEGDFKCISQDIHLNKMQQHYSIIGHHHEEGRIGRKLKWLANGFEDKLTFFNPKDEEQVVSLSLTHKADFMDLFVLRSSKVTLDFAEVSYELYGKDYIYKAQLQDGSKVKTHISFSVAPNEKGQWNIALKPKQELSLTVKAIFENNDNPVYEPPLTYTEWQSFFTPTKPNNHYEARIYEACVTDLYYLLLSTPYGFFPAAGTPLFVTPFGRDSLIVADFLAHKAPFLARSVLAYGAHIQGQKHNPYHEEEPGKIFHEVRRGTLAKLGQTPFSQYYGTADATALWLKLFGRYMEITGDISFVQQHQSSIEAAFDWIIKKLDKSGYIQFMPEGNGLSNQNWKDSAGSNCHADGSQAEPPIANIEVQAYAYAALNAAEELFVYLGNNELSAKAKQQKKALFDRIQKDFWLEDEGFYAMGLDAGQKPLKVCNSNMGHVLWCKAAPQDRAVQVIERLMQPDMWSGWGLRTLSSSAKAYDPLGYHIGTVWPHDTTMFTLGAENYNEPKPTMMAQKALADMAFARADLRLPEVLGGFDRSYSRHPIPYINSCIPQAWAAAAFIALFK